MKPLNLPPNWMQFAHIQGGLFYIPTVRNKTYNRSIAKTDYRVLIWGLHIAQQFNSEYLHAEKREDKPSYMNRASRWWS